MKRIGKMLAGLNGEFVVFGTGTVLIVAGAWMVWGMGIGLVTGGWVLIGDVLLGQIVDVVKARKKKAGDP